MPCSASKSGQIPVSERAYNFCAGPAGIPLPVLERAREELLDYRATGASVMEISHRSPLFDEIAGAAERRLRGLLGIGEEYAVLFLSGGATYQFAQVPLNLAGTARPGAYLVHGHWGRKAHAEACSLDMAHLVASSEESGFDRIPQPAEWNLPANCVYLHIVSNETITGVRFPAWPRPGIPLVADMSSDILSAPLDVSRFGVIYAGTQKNVGPAGMSIVIVRRDLLERVPDALPGILSWRTQEAFQSRYNTPPTFAWYMAGLVFEWIEGQGGLAEMQDMNQRKARILYEAIDSSGFYSNSVGPRYRSLMNVPFRLHDESLDSQFLDAAGDAGLLGLKGHKSVGGMRASIYNAMPEDGVRALVDYLRWFEKVKG
jgi:phosphoserine aminotransferase